MVQDAEILEIRPPTTLQSFFCKPPRLWSFGEQTLLENKLIGVISARQIDSDLALKSSQLLKQLTSLQEVSFIGGWHSPLEEEALRVLSADLARIVVCVSKSLRRFVPSAPLENGIADHRALLLSHCSPKAKRISREASLRRNELVAGLALALLVLSGPEGTASFKLSKLALERGKTVLTLEHRMNEKLLASGGLPATLESVRTTLG